MTEPFFLFSTHWPLGRRRMWAMGEGRGVGLAEVGSGEGGRGCVGEGLGDWIVSLGGGFVAMKSFEALFVAGAPLLAIIGNAWWAVA